MQGNFTIFLAGAALIFLSSVLFVKDLLQKFHDWLIFSKTAPFATMGIGGAWFLVNVLRLSAADFGEYRDVLFLAFALVIVLSFFKMTELLAVRGLAVLLLVLSNFALDSVYCEQIRWKNFFVSLSYAVIALAMLVGAAPYVMRDGMVFLLKSKIPRMAIGSCVLAYGTLLILISTLSYLQFPI
ncbi:MAG: hypothetical protein LBR91_03960 [Puniceicoccales bacterium]|jgi:hypothetical protein|nr:hypothetical protein [Puniceicoccales bacterium]